MNGILNYTVYGLINPLSGRLFYIGATSNIVLRFKQHELRSCLQQVTPGKKDKFIIDMGCNPIMAILEVVRCKVWDGQGMPTEARNAERKWIEIYLSRGCELSNDLRSHS